MVDTCTTGTALLVQGLDFLLCFVLAQPFKTSSGNAPVWDCFLLWKTTLFWCSTPFLVPIFCKLLHTLFINDHHDDDDDDDDDPSRCFTYLWNRQLKRQNQNLISEALSTLSSWCLVEPTLIQFGATKGPFMAPFWAPRWPFQTRKKIPNHRPGCA